MFDISPLHWYERRFNRPSINIRDIADWKSTARICADYFPAAHWYGFDYMKHDIENKYNSYINFIYFVQMLIATDLVRTFQTIYLFSFIKLWISIAHFILDTYLLKCYYYCTIYNLKLISNIIIEASREYKTRICINNLPLMIIIITIIYLKL